MTKSIEDIFKSIAEKKPEYSTGDLERRYADSLEYLDESYAFFLTHVLKIGKPEYTNTLPTAAVALDSFTQDHRQFKFLFNPDFLALLDTPQAAFILAHETMHVVLNHLKLVRNFVDAPKYAALAEKQKKHEAMTKDEVAFMMAESIKAQVFNVAADCVINDYLVEAGLPKVDGIMYGENNVGYNCANRTVTEVFDDVMKKAKQQMQNQTCPTCGGTGKAPKDDQQGQQQGQGGSGQSDRQDGDQDGQGGSGAQQDGQDGQQGQPQGQGHSHGGDQPCPDCGGSGQGQPGQGMPGQGGMPQIGNGQSIDSHDWLYDATKEMIDKAEQAYQDMQGQLPQDIDNMRDDLNYDPGFSAFGAGSEDGNMQTFVEQYGVTMAWVELLKQVDPDIFKVKGIGPKPRPSYRAPRRKTAHLYPDVILPIFEKDRRQEGRSDELPAIVLALDTSGSISSHDRNRFITLAKSVPVDRIHLFPITFTTVYRELDLENPQYSSGGTDFSCIQTYVVDKVMPQLNGKYPKAVVVITDGEASFGSGPKQRPSDEQGKSWLWLLTDYASSYYTEYKQYGQNQKLANFTKS